MKFHVGQKVRVVGPPGTEVLGRECTVTAIDAPGTDGGRDFRGIQVDIPHRRWITGFFVFQPHELEPIRDDDSREVTTWEAIRAITGYVPGEPAHG